MKRIPLMVHGYMSNSGYEDVRESNSRCLSTAALEPDYDAGEHPGHDGGSSQAE